MMVEVGIIIVLVGWLTIGLCVAVLWGDSAKQRDSIYVDVDQEEAA